MRIAVLVLLGFVASPAWAGPLGEQFSAGFGGIAWGTSLADLIGTLPGGEHFFATTTGHRLYNVPDTEPFLGVPRPQMTTHYGFDPNDKLYIVGINMPYAYREQLLHALTNAFGSYARSTIRGAATVYVWPKDQGIWLAMRASTDVQYGILQVVISKNAPAKGGP